MPTQLLDMALRLAAWLGAAMERYRVWNRNTLLAGVACRAPLKLHSLALLLPLLRGRESKRLTEGGRKRDMEVGPSVG